MGAGSRGDALHVRGPLFREDHPHPGWSGPHRLHGSQHRHVADGKLIHPEQIRPLPQSCWRTVEPKPRRPKSVAQERIAVDNGLQGVREESKPGTGPASPIITAVGRWQWTRPRVNPTRNYDSERDPDRTVRVR